MLPAFLACCNELVDRWEKEISASAEPTELDVWPEFQNLSGDVISRAAFGVSYEEGRRIFLLQAEQAERLVQSFKTNYIPGFSYGSSPPTILLSSSVPSFYKVSCFTKENHVYS
jgi:hypothetical protein